ncbi:MAG: Flp pilus assembly protein CpaB [Abditibacteriales bacterium]|nr:Flp pilus assembly protein CpaB [Abditibacteriales bacterium]MDW8366048.1 Flp pilus assembly protein CpaB [Abditibacteriales bacterium]
MRQGFLRTLLRRRPVKIALGLLIFAGLTFPFTRQQGEPAPPPQPVKVVVASTTIPPRTIITDDMVELKAMPPEQAGHIPSGALSDIGQVVNAVSKDLIARGEVVRRSHLLGALRDVRVTALLPPGRRAMMLVLNNKPQVVNLLQPGDRIDVVATFDREFSRMLVEDVEVVSVNTGSEPSQTDSPSGQPAPPVNPHIIISVTPKEAEMLALASDATLDVLLHPKASSELPRNSEGILKKEITRKWVRDRAPRPAPRAPRSETPRVIVQPPPPPMRIEPVVQQPAPSPPPPTNTVEIIAGGQRKIVEVPPSPR